MIVGVDHIAWSLPDASGAHATLTALGLTRSFAEPALPTSAAKRGLLRSLGPTHSIEYWIHGSMPAIETLVHPGAPGRVARLPTILCAAGVPGVPVGDGATALPGLGIVADRVRLVPTRTTVLRWRSGATDQLTYVVGTPDMERAHAIWCIALGARVVTEAPGSMVVRIASRLPRWRLDVVIVSERLDDPLMLDDEGFLSIGLVTTDLRGDRERLERAGVEMSASFDMSVNGRDMGIAMGRGAGDEIVELIAVA